MLARPPEESAVLSLRLSMLCRRHSVPLILCNYDGFYDGLIRFFKSCDTNGTLAARELKDIILADSNDEVTSQVYNRCNVALAEDMIHGFVSLQHACIVPQVACCGHGLNQVPCKAGLHVKRHRLHNHRPDAVIQVTHHMDVIKGVETKQSSHARAGAINPVRVLRSGL